MATRKVNVRKTGAKKVSKKAGSRRKVVTKKAGAVRRVSKKAGATRKVAKKRTGSKSTKMQLREIAATGAKQRAGSRKTRTVKGSKQTTAQNAVPTNTYYTLETMPQGAHKTMLAITVAVLNQFGAFETRTMPKKTLSSFFATTSLIGYHAKPTKTRPANWTVDKTHIHLNDHGVAWFSGRVDGSNIKQELTPELVANAVTLITTGAARGEYAGMPVRSIQVAQ